MGIGCGLYVIGGLLVISGLTAASLWGVWGFVLPFIVILVAGAVMMFFPKTRRMATGILIVSAGAWLVVIGPCLALLGGMSM
ncbi:hypothetical protein Microterr_25440 [Microbacterium terricola]|uniref:Uncharacterized protein n=1 Tax=Microbacterium terricola TaxID=344163 RepID=A0ABM8E1Q7_9MICO|nr:hypothetical protein Microterr_25440 [Microbacterium terricola]